MGLFKNNTNDRGIASNHRPSSNLSASFADKRSDVLWSAEMYLIRAVSYTYRQAISNPVIPKRSSHTQQYSTQVNRPGTITPTSQSKQSDSHNV